MHRDSDRRRARAMALDRRGALRAARRARRALAVWVLMVGGCAVGDVPGDADTEPGTDGPLEWAAPPDDGGCIPRCEDRECGDDGCGGSCGGCAGAPGSVCVEADTAVHTFIEPGECEDGRCAFSRIRTECPDGCRDGTCAGCTPSCAGRSCGADGCGGVCGRCPASPAPRCEDPDTRIVTEPAGCMDGQCVWPERREACPHGCADGVCQACAPSCRGRACGDDGCGGECGRCAEAPPPARCADDGTLLLFDAPACVVGRCESDERTVGCPHGCAEGACIECEPACAGRGCGADGCGGVCGAPCPDTPSSNEVLRFLASRRVLQLEESMTVTAPDEPATFAGRTIASTFEGVQLYSFYEGGAGRQAIRRLSNYASGAPERDRMVGVDPEQPLAGYVDEGIQGYLAQAHSPGAVEYVRVLRPSPLDRALARATAVPPGYQVERALGFAWPRHGLVDEDPVELRGRSAVLRVDRGAGGAILGMTWLGRELLNAWDLGRGLQMWLQINGRGAADQPTEAGDRFSTAEQPEGWRHGSPLAAIALQGGTLTTFTRPLQWDPEGWYGGRALSPEAHPVVWRGSIGKQVEVDYRGSPHTIRWRTTLDLPEDYGQLDIALVGAALTNDFSAFHVYDAQARAREDLSAQVPASGCLDPRDTPALRPNAGGVVLATANGNLALGVYRRGALEPEEGFRLCNFRDRGGGAPDDEGTARWSLHARPPGGLAAGRYEWTSFLVVGTLAECVAAMDALFAGGL